MEAMAVAATANGSTLRDYDFTPTGMMTASAPKFAPLSAIHRIDVAIALVKALGMDAAAKLRTAATSPPHTMGRPWWSRMNKQIPANLRGYVQIALDRGFLNAFFTVQQGPNQFQPALTATVKPNDAVTRSFLAYALDHYRKDFAAGN